MNYRSTLKTIAAIACILGAMFALLWFLYQDSIKQAQPNNQPATTSGSLPPQFATVKDVRDAITIILDSGHTVRYLGVRPPETRSVVECFGREAVLVNESIIGKKVRLEEDPILSRSKDGAWVRYVYAQKDPVSSPTPEPDYIKFDDYMVNERILEAGFGFPVLSPDMKYYDRLASSFKYGSATKKGLWGACEVSNAEEDPLKTQTTNDCVIKGSILLSGEKVYRAPECSSYADTLVLSYKGGQWFCDPEEAASSGFNKAADCP